MTSDEFTAASIALLRSAVGWQSAIARRLGIDSRTVRRWLAAGETPAWVDARLAELMGAADIAPWPRDEWLLGDAFGADGRRREYLVHLQPPRFVARVVEIDADGEPLPEMQPADVVSGTVYVVDHFVGEHETVLCEIDWIDRPPPGEITPLMEAAADAFEDITDRLLAERDG